jgi:hypothetical protein
MLMKTKEEVKKSRSREAEQSSRAKLAPAAVRAARVVCPTPRLSTLNFFWEQSENVDENKGRGQKVKESRS